MGLSGKYVDYGVVGEGDEVGAEAGGHDDAELLSCNDEDGFAGYYDVVGTEVHADLNPGLSFL